MILRSLVERTRASVERTRASVERTRASVERTRASVERTRASVERTRALALFFVAAALIVAAQGALEHPISHLGEAVQAAAQGADGDNELGGAHRCDLCVAFSATGGVADGTALPVVDVGTTLRIGIGATGEVLPRAPPPFHSQAPPIVS